MYFLLQSLKVQGSRNLDQRMDLYSVSFLGRPLGNPVGTYAGFASPAAFFGRPRGFPDGTYAFLGTLSFSSLYQWCAFPFFIFAIFDGCCFSKGRECCVQYYVFGGNDIGVLQQTCADHRTRGHLFGVRDVGELPANQQNRTELEL